MMLCIDGSDIGSLVFAYGERNVQTFTVRFSCEMPRVLGNELALLQVFLREHHLDVSLIREIGVVQGPGSPGALRSTLSFFNAWALGKAIPLFLVERENDAWFCLGSEKSFILPLYDRSVHTTPTERDALRRRISL